MNSKPNNSINWFVQFNTTILSAYFYAFMEWLFFVTKPSSLSILSFPDKLKVLVITGGVIALLILVGQLALSIPAFLAGNSKWQILAHIPSALILSITALILFDNFTYTIFKFGVISTAGIFRLAYALGFAAFFWRMIRMAQQIGPRLWKPASFLALGLLTVSTVGILTTHLSTKPNINKAFSKPTAGLPNVIILGGDGLSANYMSMYGYSQETTPFLTELAKTSLVAQNAFPNASSTTASTTSVLTGKEPASVEVFRYPDILSGNDSYEHLPGILKRKGYRTVEIGVPYYVDAQQLNLLDGFDIVNNNSLILPTPNILRNILGNSPSMYFIETIAARDGERLLHIFFVKDMENPLAEVINPETRMNDDERTEQIIQLLDESDRPIFIFAHFMDTHGPEFFSEYHVFSNESGDEVREWDVNQYKDALLSFDSHVREIYEYLHQSGQLNNTILVIYTDHGYRYAINQRIPILIHFPGGVEPVTRYNNVQVIDIPVTLLDYLDIPIPSWMKGTSMLNDEPPVDREIISVTSGSPRKIDPPFYQIKIVQMIVCQRWFALNVQENMWKSGMISGHTARCAQNLLPSEEDARQNILNYLQKRGYDTNNLQKGN